MQMLLESSFFRTKQVTKAPCATAVAARARARAASAGHVRGPRRQIHQVVFVPTVLRLMNYKKDHDYIQGGKKGVDIARRGTRLFCVCVFFPKVFFFESKRRICQRALRIRLSTYPSFFKYSPPPKKKKKGFAENRCHQKEGGETRARSQGSNPRFSNFWFQQRARRNEINTAMRSNALLTCRLAVF
jgi:hypothetical protein